MKVHVKDGVALTPEGKRMLELQGKSATPLLDTIVARPEPEPEPPPNKTASVSSAAMDTWLELRKAICESALTVRAENELKEAALVLVCGMFTRDGRIIRRLTGVRKTGMLVKRCLALKLWTDDGFVNLGEIDDPKCGDLAMWLRAMAVTGTIRIVWEGNQVLFQAGN